jgi:hypothetical protein
MWNIHVSQYSIFLFVHRLCPYSTYHISGMCYPDCSLCFPRMFSPPTPPPPCLKFRIPNSAYFSVIVARFAAPKIVGLKIRYILAFFTYWSHIVARDPGSGLLFCGRDFVVREPDLHHHLYTLHFPHFLLLDQPLLLLLWSHLASGRRRWRLG